MRLLWLWEGLKAAWYPFELWQTTILSCDKNVTAYELSDLKTSYFIWYDITRYDTILRCIVLYDMLRYDMTWYDMILHVIWYVI